MRARDQSTDEQNNAAGGAERRQLDIGDGKVVNASIAVRLFKQGHQLYGYLQFKHDYKTVTRYVGQVSAKTKAESLAIGWRMVREKKIAEANGWKWAVR